MPAALEVKRVPDRVYAVCARREKLRMMAQRALSSADAGVLLREVTGSRYSFSSSLGVSSSALRNFT